MVKVQKPIPKTIKKGGSELKKPLKKTVKPNTTKGAKKLKKTLGIVASIENNYVKPINDGLKKKVKKVLEKLDESAPKKNTIVQVHKSLKNGVPKKKPPIQNVGVPVERIVMKKKKIGAQVQQPIKRSVDDNERLPERVGSLVQRKKTIEAKPQLSIKKSVSKKRSLEEKAEKVLSKKETAVLDRQVKKKKTTLDKESEMVKKNLGKKKPIKAKFQVSVKKTSAEKDTALSEVSKTQKIAPKKKLTPAIESKDVKKTDLKPDRIKTNLTSKVQKKVSAEKIAKNKLKRKVKKNVVEMKKDLQKENADKKDLPVFEPENFDENKFKDITSLKNLRKICKTFKSLLEKQVEEKKNLIFKDFTYILNVSSYKIPNCPKRMVKLNLQHSIVDTKQDDVVLIVPDLQRGAKVDYEPTIQHYEDLLRENGIENITIIPFNKLRNEYSSFEALRKLSNTYDYFLCDGRIVSHVVGICGKNFQKSRTTFHAVRLNNPKAFKNELEHSLKRTSFRQLQKGDLISIPVGSHRLTTDQIAENIEKVIEQLKTLFPGGYANVRNIHIRADIKGTSSLPIYLSLSGAPEQTPNVVGPREQKMLKLKKEVNDILSKFNMSKSGEFVLLNKSQAKRKEKIREAREALTKKGNDEVKEQKNDSKKPKKQVEAKETNVVMNNEGSEEITEAEVEDSDVLSEEINEDDEDSDNDDSGGDDGEEESEDGSAVE